MSNSSTRDQKSDRVPLSRTQQLISKLAPRSWTASMEAESRAWVMRCECGHEQSVRDVGGIRWKASGNKRVRLRCLGCGEVRSFALDYRPVGDRA